MLKEKKCSIKNTEEKNTRKIQVDKLNVKIRNVGKNGKKEVEKKIKIKIKKLRKTFKKNMKTGANCIEQNSEKIQKNPKQC